MRAGLKFFVIGMLCVWPAYAQNAPAGDDVPLETQAIELAALADAHNMYCGKETQLIIEYIERFAKDGMAYAALEDLEKHGALVFETQVAEMIENEIDCRNVDFLLQRLATMKSLRDVSYRINGVDPSTIPEDDNLKGLEALLPPAGSTEREF